MRKNKRKWKEDAGSRVRKHCVLAGFGSLPMAMLHFRSVDPAICDAHTRVLKCKMQGLGYGNTVFGRVWEPSVAMLHFRPVDPR